MPKKLAERRGLKARPAWFLDSAQVEYAGFLKQSVQSPLAAFSLGDFHKLPA